MMLWGAMTMGRHELPTLRDYVGPALLLDGGSRLTRDEVEQIGEAVFRTTDGITALVRANIAPISTPWIINKTASGLVAFDRESGRAAGLMRDPMPYVHPDFRGRGLCAELYYASEALMGRSYPITSYTPAGLVARIDTHRLHIQRAIARMDMPSDLVMRDYARSPNGEWHAKPSVLAGLAREKGLNTDRLLASRSPSGRALQAIESLWPGKDSHDRILITLDSDPAIKAGHVDIVRGDADHLFIRTFAIEPALQGRGHGSNALDAICAIASLHGAGIGLEVFYYPDRPDGGHLVNWYERHGFTCEGAADTHGYAEMIRHPAGETANTRTGDDLCLSL